MLMQATINFHYDEESLEDVSEYLKLDSLNELVCERQVELLAISWSVNGPLYMVITPIPGKFLMYLLLCLSSLGWYLLPCLILLLIFSITLVLLILLLRLFLSFR